MNFPAIHKQVRLLCLVALCIFCYRCAHQVAPGGGPADKTPPMLVSESPSSGALNFPSKGTLTFTFSEWIDPKSAERALSVFPLPAGGIVVRTRAKTITLSALRGFPDSTTFQVELNAGLVDFHGNSMGTPHQLFFSTGAALDSGAIVGQVIDPGRRILQPKVALFDSATVASADSAWFLVPRYVVQTDSSGRFAFRFIRPATYAVVAFFDKSNLNRLYPKTEQAYAPISLFVPVKHALSSSSLMLYPVSVDTTPIKMLSLKAVAPQLLSAEWTVVPATDVALDSLWRIICLDSTRTAPSISSLTLLNLGKKVLLKLAKPLAITGYALIYPRPDNRLGHLDTTRFNGTSIADTVRPKLILNLPNNAVVDRTPRIRLIWSEPVQSANDTLIVMDSLKGSALFIRTTTAASDTISFTSPQPLAAGHKFFVSIKRNQFADLSGNTPSDTAPINLHFSTMHPDSFCLSLSGRSACLDPDTSRRWIFSYLGFKSPVYCVDKNNGFYFDTIPGGKGTLSCFVDANNDGKPTPGSLLPWRAPEPVIGFSDTVEARARWDVEGIELKCEKNTQEQKSIAQ